MEHFSTRSDFRAVTIENQVVGIERMGKNIQSASSLTQSDVIAAVAALKEEISFQLMSGNAVHLPGIGYFTLSVKGKLYQDPCSGHYRLRDPEARTVKFRPDTEMDGGAPSYRVRECYLSAGRFLYSNI